MNASTVRVSAMLATIGLSQAWLPSVEARPGYSEVFQSTYSKELSGNEHATKCTVCHYGPVKRSRNDYGSAVTKALKTRNVRDPAAIRQALHEAAKKPSATEGKSFGDLIKAGQLPGTAPQTAANPKSPVVK
ncbi:MAG: hypothetical protein U0872_08890 [Planctomycetaceae bacterium]